MQVLGIFYKYSPKPQRKLEASIAEIVNKENYRSKVKPWYKTRSEETQSLPRLNISFNFMNHGFISNRATE